MSKQPLLSICIPTYNRCKCLGEVLEEYTKNPEFDEDVELVISDNASDDDTEIMCRKYCMLYPNIVYYRNDFNIRDANFVRVLDVAHGQYLKLYNDWVYCTSDSLSFLKQRIRENVSKKDPLFFTSGHLFTKYKDSIVIGDGLNDYIRIVSTFVTYNNLFGVWRKHWDEIQAKRAYANLQLQQEDWTYQIVTNHNHFIIYDDPVFSVCKTPLGKRGGYNWFQIHLDNYYIIQSVYARKGLISSDVYKEDKKNFLRHFKYEIGLAVFYNYSKCWRFDTSGTIGLLWKYFKCDYFFYFFVLYLIPYYFYRWLNDTYSMCTCKK